MISKHQAVFLDRDGTIIEDNGYISDPARVHLLPGALQALQNLKSAGWLLIVISNQSGLGRGLFSEVDLRKVEEHFEKELEINGVKMDAAYFCFHTPEDRCDCRKPAPGLLLKAAAEWNIDLLSSWMIGDKLSDVEAGKQAGCQTILLQSKYINPPTVAQASDLKNAAEMILFHD